MGRLGVRRIVFVARQRLRLGDVAHVDDADARHPAAREHLVAAAHGVMQAMLGTFRMRRIAVGDVLVLHAPAPDFSRLRRIADVVDHQDVADIALHLGRDVGVVLVEIEAVHALAVGLVERDELRVGLVLHVVDAEAAFRIFAQIALARLALGIDHHDVADDARLVRMRPGMRAHDLRQHLRLARVGDVEDRRALRPVLMADEGGGALDHDLAAARQLHPAEVADVRRSARRGSGVGIEGRQHISRGNIHLARLPSLFGCRKLPPPRTGSNARACGAVLRVSGGLCRIRPSPGWARAGNAHGIVDRRDCAAQGVQCRRRSRGRQCRARARRQGRFHRSGTLR